MARGNGISVVDGKVSSPVTITAEEEVVSVPGVFLGAPQRLAAAAATAIARHIGLSYADISTGLAAVKPVAGRLQFIPALQKSWLLDDSYNAGPDSVSEALAVLAAFPAKHKIIVLGDMLELGDRSDSSHAAIGALVAKQNPTIFITVGKLAEAMADSAIAHGYSSNQVHRFSDSTTAAQHIAEYITPESVILVKGSQGVRMERISKALLADPMKAAVLLPRQSAAWLKR
jgi:UDP-N-acetylmuramyl pentapeptide synthase